MGPAIVEYLQRIDATLEPFGGRFIVEVWEGAWPGHLIIIEFPDRERARSWYESSANQEILPLRTNNSEVDVVVAEGVSQPTCWANSGASRSLLIQALALNPSHSSEVLILRLWRHLVKSVGF